MINLLQVFDLLGRQKFPDFLQSPFALDRVFEMSVRGGIPSGDDEEDLSLNLREAFRAIIRRVLPSSRKKYTQRAELGLSQCINGADKRELIASGAMPAITNPATTPVKEEVRSASPTPCASCRFRTLKASEEGKIGGNYCAGDLLTVSRRQDRQSAAPLREQDKMICVESGIRTRLKTAKSAK